MTDLARLPAHLAVLQRRPDLTSDEMGLLNVIIAHLKRLDHARLLIDKIELFTTLEEMLIRVLSIAQRCEASNVIPLSRRRRRLHEDAPEAVAQMRAVG